jgi:hypothetical protein
MNYDFLDDWLSANIPLFERLLGEGETCESGYRRREARRARKIRASRRGGGPQAMKGTARPVGETPFRPPSEPPCFGEGWDNEIPGRQVHLRNVARRRRQSANGMAAPAAEISGQSRARAIPGRPRRVLHGTACPRRSFDTLRPVFSGSGGMRPGRTEVNHVRLA